MQSHINKPREQRLVRRSDSSVLVKVIVRFAIALFSFVQVVAYAADGDDEKKGYVLEEITVTAEKTGESSLQDTSMAITAVSAEMMALSGVQSVRDVGLLVPGLTITSNEQYSQPFIRGVGSTQFHPGNDSATAIHIDGVYLGRPVVAFTDFVDIERIEVLRGPQGTIYGRNATAGSINLITKKPGDTLEGSVGLEFGRFDKVRVQGVVSGPLIEGKLAGKLAFMHSEDNGFVKNVGTNVTPRPALFPTSETSAPARLAVEDIDATRLSLRATPTDQLTIDFSADYSKIKGPPSVLKPFNGVLAVLFGAQDIADPWTVDFDVIPEMDHEIWGISAQIEYELDNGMTFTSITARRGSDYYVFNDEDGFEFDVVDDALEEDQTQFTQELQLLSDQSNKFSWIAGLFFFNEDSDQNNTISVVAADRGDRREINETTASAAFVQGTYNYSDKLSYTVGVRQSREKKTCSAILGAANLAPPRDLMIIPKISETWSATTPKFGVDYVLNDNVLLYGSITRGFKSGICRQGAIAEPEFLWSYEGGMKADWLDSRLRTNAAIFFYDYTDLQVFTFEAGDADISNAPAVSIWGVELELAASPIDQWLLTSGISYLSTEYDSFISSNGITGLDTDVSGNNLPFAPELTFNLTSLLTVPVGDGGEISFYGEYLWTDDIFHTQFNAPIATQEAYALVNLRANYRPNQNWDFSAYVKNATDEAYFDTLFQYGFDPDDVLGIVRPPRTYGVQVKFSF